MNLKHGIFTGSAMLAAMAMTAGFALTQTAQTPEAPPVRDGVHANLVTGPYGCAGCAAKPAQRGQAAPAAIPVGTMPEMTEAERTWLAETKPVPPGPGREPGLPQAAPAPSPEQAARRAAFARRFVVKPNPLPYDLLLANGHVIDPKNQVDRVTDVALKDGKVAQVGDHLNPKDAAKTIDVTGYIVTPGLIDIHTHNYSTTGEAGDTYAGDQGIRADDYSPRSGVTTVGDAGSSGWRNFEDFKEHVIDRQHTRILAFINIVGAGMRGGRFEQNLADMQAVPTAWMAKRYPATIIGVKSAHFEGPEWWPYIQAVQAGTIAHIPVMIDYGANRKERPLYDLLTKYLRPGDIYTHVYSNNRGEQDMKTLGPQAGLVLGRKRGIYFDAGTGGGSFRFRTAVPLLQDGFSPDSLSTDHHSGSMNSSTKDMINVMSKFMAMGQSLQDVVTESTWHPAIEIQHRELGNLSPGTVADVTVLSEEHGKFGYLDMDNTKLMGTTRLVCQLTIKDGKVIYDLNGLSMDGWNQMTPSSDPAEASHWTTYRPRPPQTDQVRAKDRM